MKIIRILPIPFILLLSLLLFAPGLTSVGAIQPAAATPLTTHQLFLPLMLTQPPPPSGFIAFSSWYSWWHDIDIVAADGSNLHTITDSSCYYDNPDWSPDGAKIALDSTQQGNSQIYVMDADGSNLVRLTAISMDLNVCPAWSPDGTKIAYYGELEHVWDIFVMNTDGTEKTNLTHSEGHEGCPDWSPDSSKIVFSSDRGGQNDLWIIDADGSNPRQLTNDALGDRSPAWSPQGDKIAFVIWDKGQTDIHVINVDGSARSQLTTDLATDLDPAWSPDGEMIAFTSMRDGHYQIYLMNADGTWQRRLLNSNHNDMEPSWTAASSISTASPLTTGAPYSSISNVDIGYDLFWYLTMPNWPDPNLIMLNNGLSDGGWSNEAVTAINYRQTDPLHQQDLLWAKAGVSPPCVASPSKSIGSSSCCPCSML